MTYAVERSKPCSAAIYRRWKPFPTPDESPINRPFRDQGDRRATTAEAP